MASKVSKQKQQSQPLRFNIILRVGVILIAAVAVLALLFALNRPAQSTDSGDYPYAVGVPGPGNPAPDFTLLAGGGGSFSLAANRGKGVLLFFHEGGGCESCWVQLRDLERSTAQLKALGIDQVVSITTEPLEVLNQRAAQEKISIPLLSDASVQVSTAYTTNNYTMMNDRYDGHSFILVDGQGLIRWRADYGGAPRYTMYVPMANLLAEIKRAQKGAN